MTIVFARCGAVRILVGLVLFLIAADTPGAAALPCADEVMRNVVERAQRTPDQYAPGHYHFHKRTTTEEFDSKGRVRERQEKIEEVIFNAGAFFRKRIRHEGRTALDDQLGDGPDQAVMAGEPDLGEVDMAGFKRFKRGDYIQFFTPELIARYDFKMVRRIELDGRPTLEIYFHPKQRRLPARQLIDRIFNEVAGTLWIDEDESEVARGHFILISQVYIFGGIAGVIRGGEITVQRSRIDDGVWFNHVTDGDITGRKLFESGRLKIHSISDQFQELRHRESDLEGTPERSSSGS